MMVKFWERIFPPYAPGSSISLDRLPVAALVPLLQVMSATGLEVPVVHISVNVSNPAVMFLLLVMLTLVGGTEIKHFRD